MVDFERGGEGFFEHGDDLANAVAEVLDVLRLILENARDDLSYGIWITLAIDCNNVVELGHIKDVIRVYELAVVFESKLILLILNRLA